MSFVEGGQIYEGAAFWVSVPPTIPRNQTTLSWCFKLVWDLTPWYPHPSTWDMTEGPLKGKIVFQNPLSASMLIGGE